VLNAVVLRPLRYNRPGELARLTTHLMLQDRPDGKSARSVRRGPDGRVPGSTRDPVLAQAVEIAGPLGIAKRIVQRARARLTGSVRRPAAFRRHLAPVRAIITKPTAPTEDMRGRQSFGCARRSPRAAARTMIRSRSELHRGAARDDCEGTMMTADRRGRQGPQEGRHHPG
jgi:hypothetical protein